MWTYRSAEKSLARPGRKQARKHVRDARDFNNIETRAIIKFPPPPHPQGKAPKEIHAILTETLACFLPGRAKDLSAPLYTVPWLNKLDVSFNTSYLPAIFIRIFFILIFKSSGFGGLGVACWPLVPKFAGSNPAEADGFLGAKKSSARLPSEGK